MYGNKRRVLCYAYLCINELFHLLCRFLIFWLIPTYNSASALLRAQRFHRCSTVSQLRLLRVAVVAWTHMSKGVTFPWLNSNALRAKVAQQLNIWIQLRTRKGEQSIHVQKFGLTRIRMVRDLMCVLRSPR